MTLTIIELDQGDSPILGEVLELLNRTQGQGLFSRGYLTAKVSSPRTRSSFATTCPPSAYADIREGLPGIKLVQVVHVEGSHSVDYAISASVHVDAILVDSGTISSPIRCWEVPGAPTIGS